MKKQTHIFAKTLTGMLALSLFIVSCTKKRDAALPDTDAVNTFAISDFGTTDAGFTLSAKQSVHADSADISASKATEQTGLVTLDASSSNIPDRLRFMFDNLDVSGQESSNFQIVFAVDSKYVTAYKKVGGPVQLSILEKQLALSPAEVQTSIDIQKAKTPAIAKSLSSKMSIATKTRLQILTKSLSQSLLVPMFKYEIKTKGVLVRSKNEARESTSNLYLTPTEFNAATHITLDITSDARKEIGSAEQKQDLDQIYTMNSLDNHLFQAADLQNRFNFKMKFVADDTKVLTKLDSNDMKVYEMTDISKLTQDERRLLQSGRGNGEVLKCANEAAVNNKDANCALRLVATVPVTYKNLVLNPADNKDNTLNTLRMDKVTKNESQGLVEIAREVRAVRAQASGMIDPLNTIKVSDIKGDFYFRRTFEDASNMLKIGQTGTSGDMVVAHFEMEDTRLVVRNQKALITYVGQGPLDKEELMSMPVKYFKLETVDADGVKLQVPNLVQAKKEDAEYLEIDWTTNTIPVANSPLAYYEVGDCIKAQTSQTVTSMDMRLATDGIMNFSLSGAYTLNMDCVNINQTNGTGLNIGGQFNYNVVERLSFKKKTDASQDIQFAPNVSPASQNAMNFEIFTLAEKNTDPRITQGRDGSQNFKPMVHDFRNGKILQYWVGGLANSASDRRDMINQAAKEVVADWNAAFHRAFKGTNMDRSGDYIQLNIEDGTDQGHLGDLDRNYLWFMDKPAENGLLGVAQPASNPYSGTIVANNVIVYSGNSETEVRSFLLSYTQGREYEKLLEQAKTEALADFQKQQQDAQKAATSSAGPVDPGATAIEKAQSQSKSLGSYLQRLLLSARPKVMARMSSQYANYIATRRYNPKSTKTLSPRLPVTDLQITSNKDFTRRVLQQAFQGEFKNDPIMLEAIVAREMARTDGTLSPTVKALLIQKSQMTALKAKFDKAARLRGGCFLYTREDYNDKFISTDFATLFKNEIKFTLAHEMGHSLGLMHNFKGSYDRENFNFPGETTDRAYSSIMDYIASAEMTYQGPGPYDVHALRAIYANLIEVSDTIKTAAAKTGGVLQNKIGGSITLVNGTDLPMDQVRKFLGFTNESDMRKQLVDHLGVLKHFGECDDEQVGEEAACQRYDLGSTPQDIVKYMIQDYNRMYVNNYHAMDRLNFGFDQKMMIINRAIMQFAGIRNILDTMFKMRIYGTALNQDEMQGFLEASYLGYDFFHNLIRIPDTNLGYGTTVDEVKQRLIPVNYTRKTPVLTKAKDGSTVQATDASGQPQFQDVPMTKIVEARATYDVNQTIDRIDTFGIGYDKAFALEFLLTANPTALSDDKQTGWLSYSDFEQMFLGVTDPTQSQNMLTLINIMSGNLSAGFVDDDHTILSLNQNVTINQTMLNNADVGAIILTNAVRTTGLDRYAEFFKVGILKTGQTLTDRPVVHRYGQTADSQAAINFYGTDNGVGATILVATAARKTAYLDHKAEIADLQTQMLDADKKVMADLQQVIQDDAAQAAKNKTKPQTAQQLLATNDTLKGLHAVGDQAAANLVKLLTSLNVRGLLVSADELKQNPNLAFDKQVDMLRGMTLKNFITFSSVLQALQSVNTQADMNPIIKALQQPMSDNSQLANLELLALGQEIMADSVVGSSVTLANGNTLDGPTVLGTMMPSRPLSAPLETLMFSIEDLARYTRMINPEYAN